jgi:hypothetical protein
MIIKLLLIFFISLIVSNILKVNYNTEKGCNSVAYVFFGTIGTIVTLAYIFGGGIS